jgi:hypothetical protein
VEVDLPEPARDDGPPLGVHDHPVAERGGERGQGLAWGQERFRVPSV